jgi:hypothetical protein
MKKKIVYGSLIAVAFVLSLVFKTKPDENLQQALIDPSILMSWAGDINLGGQNCVCKGSSCSEANWISFREYCGMTSGSNTDSACSRVGKCND